MGDLRDKLRRAHGLDAGPGGAAPVVPVRSGAGLREYLRRRAERQTERRPIVELPPGEEIDNEGGRCWLRRLHYPLTHDHGDRSLAAAHTVDWPSVGALAKDSTIGTACLRDCVFVDTETTGLGGGAGTTVFLTGLAFFTDDGLVLEQVFLRSFDDERAALTHVAQRLAEHPLPVTFVGKTFDRHRLATRMVLHRIESPVLQSRHLDLYYLARRAWRHELPDCRLRTIEERRLGLHRRDDLPGREAPLAFLDWLRDRTGPIDRVLEHNRLDVLSLVALLARLGERAYRAGAKSDHLAI